MEEYRFFFELDGPLEVVPAKGQTRASTLTGFEEYVRKHGADASRILKRHGLDPRVLANPDAHIPAQAMVNIFEECSILFDDPIFGLHFALTQQAEAFGCMNSLCRAAPDMRAAMDALIKFLPLTHSPEADLEFIVGGDMAHLRWGSASDLGINEQTHYQALVLLLKLLRSISGPDFAPSSVQLMMDVRACDMAELEAAVNAPVVSNADHFAIHFPARLLDRSVTSANRLTYRLLGGYLGRLRIVNRVDIVERTASYVRGSLPTPNCSVERCAGKLGLSVRTLQARLTHHGVSFSDIVEDQREKLAKIYLGQTPMALDEVAERLGYGEQTSFGRAFKRWTGTTPRKFRMQSLSEMQNLDALFPIESR